LLEVGVAHTTVALVVGALVDIDARLLEKILAVAVLRNLN
jgi:hypothetical protein